MQWEKPRHLFGRRALTDRGWERDVLVAIRDGVVEAVTASATALADTPSFDLLLPGMSNVHAHAFQRAMAGLTEAAAQQGRDNFWSWREVMYAFTAALTPDQVQAIAAALYIELLKQGYTSVGEFHYLHNDPAGKPYAAPTELSDRVIAAAMAAGIQLTLLPVLYETADFGGVPAHAGQRRFFQTAASYLKLVEALVGHYGTSSEVVFGVAPHSLRAATPDSIFAVLAALPNLGLETCPIHMHVSEQEKEVADCLAWSGQRPVAWLLDHMPVDARWCLIHATHIAQGEMKELIHSGASAGLCPSTEANLGDGVFPAEAFLKAGGRFGIGSDSDVCVSPWEELRLLEYAQRLTLRKRAVLYDETTPSVGRTLYSHAAANGARVLGLRAGVLAVGNRADVLALTTDSPLLAGKEEDRILDTLIFGLPQPVVTDVFVAGKRVIDHGRHPQEEACASAFRRAMEKLCAAI